MPGPREALVARLRRQAAWCAADGSPLYAALLEKAAHDLEVNGPVRDVLEGFEDEPGTAAVALRFMAAVHRLVLDDTLPELARHYPSTGGEGDPHTIWPLFRQALIDHRDEVHALVANRCQTNDVGRSAALLGGFLEVARQTQRPLRILELGASAGLNLRWDRYRYESTEGAWGDPGSKVVFAHHFDVPPPMHTNARVAERKGCDLKPIDPMSEDGRLTLRASIWPDQLGRLALLDGALEMAAEAPVEVEQVDAVSFLQRELARRAPEMATVVFHSVFMQYLPEPDRARVTELIGAGWSPPPQPGARGNKLRDPAGWRAAGHVPAARDWRALERRVQIEGTDCVRFVHNAPLLRVQWWVLRKTHRIRGALSSKTWNVDSRSR